MTTGAPQLPKATQLGSFIVGFFTHRMSLWLWVTVALGAGIYFLARHMVSVMLFKLALMTMAGYLGYWIARALEHGHRPHEFIQEAMRIRAEDPDSTRPWELEQLAAQAAMRRVYIVASCLLASAMGG